MYEAANWSYVGNSKGYARSNGHYTDPHGKPKRLYVRALRSDACDIASVVNWPTAGRECRRQPATR